MVIQGRGLDIINSLNFVIDIEAAVSTSNHESEALSPLAIDLISSSIAVFFFFWWLISAFIRERPLLRRSHSFQA